MYVPDCENCIHREDCAVLKALCELRETMWNIGRAEAGRTDYILNGKYYPAEKDKDHFRGTTKMIR